MTDETVPIPAIGHDETLPVEYTSPKADGRFRAGTEWTGNKDGRPKGIKNRITVQRLLVEEGLREQLAVNAEALLAKAVIMALNGNDRIMRALLDKVLSTPKNDDSGDVKDNSVSITIKNLTTAPTQPVATVSPGKVRVITSETPIEGEFGRIGEIL